MKRMGVATLACAVALTVACNSNARNNARTDTGNEPAAVGTSGEANRTAVHDGEKDFINEQVADGNAEVELGKLAAQRAVNPDVKQFAEMMVRDHTMAGNELKDIAGRYNVQPAPDAGKKHQDVMDKLSKLRGAEFDKEYVKTMVDDHKDAVGDLESRVDSNASVKDKISNKDSKDTNVVPEKTDNAPAAAVNEWAAKVLPTVRHHLDAAKTLDDRLSNTRNTTARNTARDRRPAADDSAPAHR
jgi:putative membrane protein